MRKLIGFSRKFIVFPRNVADSDRSSDFDCLLEDDDSKDGEIEENELTNPCPIHDTRPIWPSLNPSSLGAMGLEDCKASEGSS